MNEMNADKTAFPAPARRAGRGLSFDTHPCAQEKPHPCRAFQKAGYGTRTRDLRITNASLYQLS